MNLFTEGALDSTAGLFAAALIGIAFGFWLERAGFGSSRKLTSIFYLKDFAVLQVMFTAIVTALVGLQALSALGLVAPENLYRMETVLAPQVVGGLVFGAGFVTGGWCPGTALVGLASGKLDALVFLGGAAAGSLGFAAAYPRMESFLSAGACGVITLPETIGLSPGFTTLLVLLVALGAFFGVDRLAARLRPR